MPSATQILLFVMTISCLMSLSLLIFMSKMMFDKMNNLENASIDKIVSERVKEELEKKKSEQVSLVSPSSSPFILQGDDDELEIPSPKPKKDKPETQCEFSGIQYSNAKAGVLFPATPADCGDRGAFSFFNETSGVLFCDCNQAKYAIWLDNDGKARNYFPIMQAVPQDVNAVGDADIILVSCGRIYDSHIQNVKRYELILETKQTLKKLYPDTHTNTLPLSFNVVFLESVSRAHFARKLPKTHDLLLSLEPDLFTSFDFKTFSIVGSDTPTNMIPFVLGMPLSKLNHPRVTVAESGLLLEGTWRLEPHQFLWEYFKQLGYVTQMGEEECTAWLDINPNTLTISPTDHLFQRFYCVSERIARYSPKATTARCINGKPAHVYLLEYMRQFHTNYIDVPRFSFNHFLEGRETTGSVIGTLDEDLEEYLPQYFENNTITIIVSDHGMKYAEWKTSQEGIAEYRNPVLKMVVPTWFLKKYPRAQANLEANQDRLITMFDLHNTLKHFAAYPKLPASLSEYGKSLLDKISNTRTCWEANIPVELCSCLPWEPVMVDLIEEELAPVIAAFAIETSNSQNSRFKFCRPLSLSSVIEMKQQSRRLDNDASKFDINYRVTFSTEDGNEWQATVNHRKGTGKLAMDEASQGAAKMNLGDSIITLTMMRRISTEMMTRDCVLAANAVGAKADTCVCY